MNEVDHIVSIVLDQVPPDVAEPLFDRLYREVGLKTDNISLSISLCMLDQALKKVKNSKFIPFSKNDTIPAESEPINPGPTEDAVMPIKLRILIALHAAAVIGNAVAIIILPFLANWYVAMPLITMIVWLLTSKVADCPLTRLENKLRRAAGLEEIRGFISYYFYRPTCRWWLKLLRKFI